MRDHSDHLPAAVVTEKLLREINSSIPQLRKRDVTWTADIGDTTIQNSELEAFLKEISEEQSFEEVTLSVYDDAETDDDTDDVEIALEIGNDSSLWYTCSQEQEGDLALFSRTVVGIFQGDKRRFIGHIPRTLAHPRWLLRSSKFKIGKQKPSFLSGLSWHSIVENIIARVVSHVFVGVSAFVVGLLIGVTLL